jgi:DnaD/phage-associated family protein
MGVYRPVQTNFWNDVKIQEKFSPEDKLFFLYLLTNPHTKQLGVYQITYRQMAFELGYSEDSIKSMMRRFQDHHEMIKYDEDTREICIVNWGRYNFNQGGKPVEDLLRKELTEVKNLEFVELVATQIPDEKKVKKALYRLLDESWTSRGTSRGRVVARYADEQKQKQQQKQEQKQQHQQQQNNEQNTIDFEAAREQIAATKEEQKQSSSVLVEEEIKNVIIFWQNNGFGMATPYMIDQFNDLLNDYGPSLVQHALETALKAGSPRLAYVEGCLNNWEKAGLKTVEDVQASEKQRLARHTRGGSRIENTRPRTGSDPSAMGSKW